MDLKKSAATIVLAVSLVFTACSTPPPKAVPKPAPQPLKVSLVEPKNFGGRFNAAIFEDMAGTLVAAFGALSVAQSLEDALASNPDVVVFLSITSEMATHNSSVATVDVEARFTGKHGTILDEFHIHTRQRAGPIQRPHEINEGVREQTRAKLQQAILGSPKLARIVKAQPATSKTLTPRPRPNADLPLTLNSDIDSPRYQLAESPQSFALVIGIEQYADLPAASFAVRDAEAVWHHLQALGYPKRNVVILTQRDATRDGIRKYLTEWLPSKVTAKGTVFFYYAGHGAPDPETGEAYLVPWDGDSRFLETTANPLKEIHDALASLPAKQAIMVLDCSFSGAGGRSVPVQDGHPNGMAAELKFLSPPKTVMFAAAGRSEITNVLEDQGHGLFTYYFLKGLSGAAKNKVGAVTLQGLYKYVKPLVEDAARRQKGNQTPALYGLQRDQVIAQF